MTPFDFNAATPEEIRTEADRRQRARDGWNGDAPMTEAQKRRKEMLLEKEEQSRVVKLYARHACKVRIYSEPRKAKFTTPGGSDLQVFSPTRENGWPGQVAWRKRIMWYHETKRPVGGALLG